MQTTCKASKWTVPNEMQSYQGLYLLLRNFCLSIKKKYGNLLELGLLYWSWYSYPRVCCSEVFMVGYIYMFIEQEAGYFLTFTRINVR